MLLDRSMGHALYLWTAIRNPAFISVLHFMEDTLKYKRFLQIHQVNLYIHYITATSTIVWYTSIYWWHIPKITRKRKICPKYSNTRLENYANHCKLYKNKSNFVIQSMFSCVLSNSMTYVPKSSSIVSLNFFNNILMEIMMKDLKFSDIPVLKLNSIFLHSSIYPSIHLQP